MNTDDASDQYTANSYTDLLSTISQQILQSHYRAARLVNRELLLLYFAVGRKLSEKINAEKWGAKVVEQLSADLQKQLPGLRGFSRRNLFNMKAFTDEYADLTYLLATLNNISYQETKIVQLPTAQFYELPATLFLGISFTHHILLLNRCSSRQERLFYMVKATQSQWTVDMLDWQLKTG